MTEDHATYGLRDHDGGSDLDGVQHIGELLCRLIDERNWQLLKHMPPSNGNRRGGTDSSASLR